MADLEKAVDKGLVMGRDLIIFYKYDYLVNREVSAFKYFKTVWDAKNKLMKGSKSYKNRKGLKANNRRKSNAT